MGFLLADFAALAFDLGTFNLLILVLKDDLLVLPVFARIAPPFLLNVLRNANDFFMFFGLVQVAGSLTIRPFLPPTVHL